MGNYLKRTTTFILALLMLLSVPLQAFANVNYEDLSGDKAKFVNELKPVKPAKTDNAEEFIKNPDQPAIYTLRTDYKVQRGEKYYIDYQPYIASVGEAATPEEKAKVDKTIKLPELAGYEKPEGQKNFKIDYKTVKDAADGKNATGDKVNGLRYFDKQDFKYTAKNNTIKIKHVFQDLEDFTKYTNPDGTITQSDGSKGTLIKKGETQSEDVTIEEVKKHELITTQSGNTGSTMEVSPLDKNDPRVKGFVPERKSIMMQVPENAENFILEYRYNRAHYDVVYDTAGGTPLPTRTLYTGQVIPKIAAAPTKVGGDFLGWKPSVELKTKDGKTFKANEIIAVGTGQAIEKLDNDLIMPAEKLTFTAVWKDKDKAGYAVQFWAEKADHADNASLADKYDFIGTHVYTDQNTGSRPDLDNVSVDKIVFPDLDQARLAKIWAGDRFNRGRYLYLNKFYVYNKDLTHEQNVDPANVNLVKSVDPTGRTVYNIYYDRQVYDLYFTKSNAQPAENTFYPEIWGLDKNNKQVKLGGPGNPYHYKARFNQLMTGWPNDAMQTKGFSEGMQSYGWVPNYEYPIWPLHLDTPPYRLNADEFLDMGEKPGEDYENRGGYTKHIDKGDGTSIDLPWYDFTTLSFGIKQDKGSMPHHMDFWMDGFKGEQIVRYDLYRSKADTKSSTYQHRYSQVQGFTPKGDYVFMEPFTEDDVDGINAERAKVTPFPTKEYTDMYGAVRPIGKMPYIYAFFNNADEYGDAAVGDVFPTNGYIKFEYYRNKYPLRFNCDPSKIKGDNEFNSTNQLQTFYEFPLKALSPTVDTKDEYKKDNPANLLDNPENLQTLGLTDLIFTDPADGKLKVKRPDNLSDQMVFKGWALDPAGTKLIWENPGEKMPSHPVNLYAKWGEPDYQWKVTFDPNGGALRNIDEKTLTTEQKTIQVGDKGQEEIKTFPIKKESVDDKQVFTVIQRQKLVEPKKPTRRGYDFMGWEVIRYTKDATTGDYTNVVDTSYRDTYKVPELYSFGNDVVSPIYLKAIWVPNDRVNVDVVHHFLSLDLSEETREPLKETLASKRAGYMVATSGDQQNEELTLADHKELEEKLTGDLKTLYDEYNGRVKANNTFFQTFRVEPEKIDDGSGNLIDNPKAKNNVFHFFYRPFRTRDYKVNYIDERFKDDPTKGAIIEQEKVSNGNRHFDARNYRPIPGWKLVSPPQQQLFFDVNEETNAFLGINGTGKDEITFYYKDVRVIEVSNKDDPVPDGYVRVTYKADKGGSFGRDAQGKDITELNYDVIKGLKSDLLPVPKELAEGETADAEKHYITPETGKKFIKWDNRALLNDNTIINAPYTFTAYFEWSGLTASGLVRTEAFKDPNGKWTNDFAPKIEDLKKQLVWKEKNVEKPLPAGAVIKLYDENDTELTSDDQVYELVKELNKADKDELVRTVNVKAKVTFTDGKDPQELNIPITVYKNVYEALNKAGDKPLFLKEAEGKDAKDGGLRDVTGDYVMVTIKPTPDMNSKDDKIYWVNKNAWVEIPEVKPDGSSTFVNWTADQAGQNDDGQANGKFDFAKRHKFTTATIIQPVGAGDVVEQTDPTKKPNVPDSYVKVIVKTTDKATDETAFEKTFWVNPTKEVTIGVTNPTGKTVAADPAKVGAVGYTMTFSKWESTETTARVWEDKIVGQFTAETTILAKYTVTPEVIKPQVPSADTVHTPQGKTPTVEEITKMITPPEGKTISKVTIVDNPDVSTPGDSKVTVIVEYDDGSVVGKEKPIEIPVKVHEPIVKADPLGNKPKEAMKNYVKVIFKAGTGGTVSGDLVYYVSPEVEVDMTESAGKVTKTPEVGYTANGGTWSPEIKAEKITAEKTYEFNFVKSEDIVEKSNDPNQVIPKGYVKVTFKTEDEAKGKLEGDVKEKIYYVNPTAGIKLGKTATADNKTLVVPTPAANTNYVFDKWQEAIDETTPITSERIHVAIFQSGKVTLTYKPGEGTGTVPEAVKVGHGTKVRLARPEGLSKDNATFAGWKIGDKTYQVGDEVTLNENTTATAQWTAAEHTVTFNSMGGSNVPSQTVAYGSTAKEPSTKPILEGKVFMGWKEKGKESQQDPYFNFSTPITADKTLIAIWQDPVQKINDGDPVEEQFIKVTFKQGAHGTLNGDEVTYKVAKGLSFEEAKGLIVPEIVPNKYYKAKDANKGWDKALDLTLAAGETEKIFTAQYEPEADVIPVDITGKSPEEIEELRNNKPEGTVVVEFSVDTDKAILDGNIFFYVKKNTEVTIDSPSVLSKSKTYDFKGWKNVTVTDDKIIGSFTENTKISDEDTTIVGMTIEFPVAGQDRVRVITIEDGEKGKLQVMRRGVPYTFDTKTYSRRRKSYTIFDISTLPLGSIQSGDMIKYWTEKDGKKSTEYLEVIK